MSPAYQLLRQALLARRPLSAVYDDHYREFCPHVLGMKEGSENVLVYQFGGTSSTPLGQQGRWRCFHVGKIQMIKPLDDPWRNGNKRIQPPGCVDEIDVFVPL
jgi:hypothetical protein